MSKSSKQKSTKVEKKAILVEIEGKLEETVKGYALKVSNKKFKKNLHKAGKLLSKSLSREKTTAQKRKVKSPKFVKEAAKDQALS